MRFWRSSRTWHRLYLLIYLLTWSRCEREKCFYHYKSIVRLVSHPSHRHPSRPPVYHHCPRQRSLVLLRVSVAIYSFAISPEDD